MRPAGLVAVARGSSYLFIVPTRPEPILLEDVDVEALAAVLARCALPVRRDELLAHCDDSALTMLVELGVLLPRADEDLARERAPRVGAKRCGTIVVGLSAAVGVVRALDHVVALADGFAERVEVVVSPRADHFIQPKVFEYHGLRTWSDPYAAQHGVAVPHSHLAAAADLVLIAPASAGTLHRLATGACSDLISLIVASTTAPVVIAPSMAHQMWRHPPIQRNVAQLRADGCWVIEPGPGFKIAERDQVGVGGLGFDPGGLARALDAILTSAK